MNFDSRAHRYEAAACIQHDLIQWGAGWIEADLHQRTVLELGAGVGALTRILVQRAPARLVAVDVSPKMIALGRQAHPSAEWQLMDAWEPQLSGFDRIYSSSLLQWAPQPEASLRRWHACLNPGGRLFVLLFIQETLPELQQLVPHLRPVLWRSRDEWETHLIKAGLNVLRSEVLSKVYTFPSAVSLFRSFHHIGATQPWRLGTRALRRTLRHYEERFAEAGGGVRSTWTFYRVECRREGHLKPRLPNKNRFA